MNPIARLTSGMLFHLFLIFSFLGCGGDDYTLKDQFRDSLTPIRTELSYFKDAHGRYLFVHGVNVSGSSKFPRSFTPRPGGGFVPSYVGKPFPLEEADHNFRILRELGFNVIRLVMTWEAVQPEDPRNGGTRYDEAYLDYLEKIVAKANEYGIYCLMDMHQDLFSRHLYQMFHDALLDEGDRFFNEPDDPLKADTCLVNNPAPGPGKPAMVHPNNVVRGDGAPQWVVKLTLPEKNVGNPDYWGLQPECMDAANPSRKLIPNPTRNTPEFLPWTLWGINAFLSIDVIRSFATLFAGRDVYPLYTVPGTDRNIQDYLQDHFADAWRQVVRRVRDYPNVIGYDILNEPSGIYILFSLYALFWTEASVSPGGLLTETQVQSLLNGYLQQLVASGTPLEATQKVKNVLLDYDLLPRSLQEIQASGFYPEAAASPYKPDIDKAFALNFNFNRTYLQPFHEKVSKAILEEDPEAVLFIELTLGLPDTGLLGMMAFPMTRPEGVSQMTYAPHWYTDIYPELGMNMPPRDFTVEEKQFRDYLPGIEEAILPSTFSLGKPPTVVGEFGTYYNFGGIRKAMAQDYVVSSVVLDRYFEAYESLLLHHMLWCYSPENLAAVGEGWNNEDFSLLGPDGRPRSALAYSRPFPRYLSGKPVSLRFYSDYHYYDPDPYEPIPRREFEVAFKTRETAAPTEIFVPPVQYPEGFYVYLSDGHCYYDPDRFILYYYPEKRDPHTVHNLRMRPPYPNYGDRDWQYFFRDSLVITNP